MPLRWQDVERYRDTRTGRWTTRKADEPEVEGHVFATADHDEHERDGDSAESRPR